MGIAPSSETNDADGSQFAIEQIGDVYQNVRAVVANLPHITSVAGEIATIQILSEIDNIEELPTAAADALAGANVASTKAAEAAVSAAASASARDAAIVAQNEADADATAANGSAVAAAASAGLADGHAATALGHANTATTKAGEASASALAAANSATAADASSDAAEAHKNDLLAATGSGLVGFTQAGAGAAARTTQAKLRDIVSVKDFGAVGDGVADDTAEIQAAVDSLAATGGEVFFPVGTYKISATITLANDGVSLRGANKHKTSIIQASGGSAVIDVSSADYCTISDLTIGYSVAPTAGSVAAILANGQYCRYRSLVISSCYVGIKFTISPFQNATDIQIFNYISAGVLITAVNDIFVSQFTFNAGNAANGALGGIRMVERCEAIVFVDGEILNGVYAMTVDAAAFTSGNRPAYNNFTNVFFDSASQPVLINNAIETKFVSCWFSNGRSGGGAAGCLVQQVDTVKFIGCRFFNCGAEGCNVQSTAKRVSWLACSFESNSVTAGAGVAHGLNIQAGTTDFSIIGCKAHNGLFTGTQGYGIAVLTGASDRYVITGCQVSGNATGGIFDGGTGTAKHITNNLGARTQNRGQGMIASGTTSVTVAHGLSFTPTQADVLISPNVQLGALGVSDIWCSAADATNITVNVNVAPPSGLGFTWDVRMKGA